MRSIMSFMTKLLKNKKSVNFKLIFSKSVILIIGIISLFFVTSCRNSPSVLGITVLPEEGNLNVHYIAWDGVYGYSVIEDSVRTDDLPVNIIGSMYDSTFGVTNAGVATQFVLSSNGVSFGENPQLDSMILEVRYTGNLFGDSTSQLTLHVEELSEDLIYDTAYYSNYNFQTYGVDYADKVFVPSPNDSTIVGDDTIAPTLRINLSALNPELAEKILNADSADLADNESFLNLFKGLYIYTEQVTTGGSLFTVDFTAPGSRLSIYFSNDEEDSLLYNFYVAATASARINTYSHDYSLAADDFKQQVLQGDTALGTQKFYVQGTAGVKAIIKIPELINHDSLQGYDHIAINEAKLYLPGLKKSKYPPGKLALVRILEDGSYEPMEDEYEGAAYFGGEYNEGSNLYMYRITRYVQKLISDTNFVDNGLYLFVSGASYRPNSFVFKGNLNGEELSGVKLEILYTIVN